MREKSHSNQADAVVAGVQAGMIASEMDGFTATSRSQKLKNSFPMRLSATFWFTSARFMFFSCCNKLTVNFDKPLFCVPVALCAY